MRRVCCRPFPGEACIKSKGHYSVYRGGRVEIIPNDQGHRITPSWVSFTDQERL